MSSSADQDQARFKKTHDAITGGGSPLAKYQNVMVGSGSFWATIYFEFCSWLGIVPGAVGLLLRKVFWPRMFKACGKGVQFGWGVTLRHPNRIRIGDNVVVSEGCILDGRNPAVDVAIDIGADVIMANASALSAKGGTISIGAHTGIGTQTVIQSTNDCPTTIGAGVIIGPQCYLVGGGTYNIDQLDVPMWQQGIAPDSGCHLRDNVWLGGKVTVLGNVVMEAGSVAAAGAVVNQNVEPNMIVGGIPAKPIRSRAASA